MTGWSLKGLAPFVMLVGVACAAPGDVEQSSTATNGVTFFSEAYGHITDHYVRDVDMRPLVVEGLQSLHEIDNSIQIRTEQSRIAISRDDQVRSQLPMPQGNDPRAWANATVETISAAQALSPQLAEAEPEQIYEAIMDSLVARLDIFSRYASASEARNLRAMRDGYTGIGISIRKAEHGIEVVRVYRNTPAERAGLMSNDLITRIGDQEVNTEDLPGVVGRLRGPEGSEVRVTVRRDGRPDPFDLMIARQRVTPNMVEYRREGDIAYILVERFTVRTSEHLALAIRRARAEIGPRLQGYVIDLRNNPGGLLYESVKVSNLFLDGGRIVSTRGRHPDSHQEYFARTGDMTEGKPIVILINGRSASASEIVAGALQDTGRAIVVGSNSYGKGTVQSEIDLPNSGALSITWSRFHTPSGYALQGLGILPNVCTSRSGESEANIESRLRGGRSATGPYFVQWRTTPVDNEDARARLRRVCPSLVEDTRNADDSALHLAYRILGNGQLYSAALRQAQPGPVYQGMQQQSRVNIPLESREPAGR